MLSVSEGMAQIIINILTPTEKLVRLLQLSILGSGRYLLLAKMILM